MKEEVQRISRLVAEGKLSPEDAADLIDAFYASDRATENRAEEPPREEARQTPPPPPPGAGGPGPGYEPPKDPFKGLIDSIEKLTKEGLESINWQEVSKQAKHSAKKGIETLKSGIDDISKGKVNLGWLTATQTREIELPLAIPAGKTLRIENPCGDVKVVGGFDVGSVRAEAKFRASTLEESKLRADEFMLIIEEADHAVLIRQPDVTGLSIDFEIQVPGTVPIELRLSSGDVKVIDTGASCRIHSKSGDVELRGLNGLIEVHSDSGDVKLEDSESPQVTIDNKSGDLEIKKVHGNLNARTASGNISVEGGSGKVVAIESVSGDSKFDSMEPITGTVSVRTVSGNIDIKIVDGSDCRVSLSTMRGDLRSEVTLQDEARAEQRVTGRLGAGTGSLELSAITGDVSLAIHDSVGSTL